MERETFLFLIAAGTGAGLFLFYRVLGIFRWMFPGRRSVAFFDLLYWILSGSVVFAELYQYNEGVLRLFLLPAVFFGAFLMNSLLKRLLSVGQLPDAVALYISQVKASYDKVLFIQKMLEEGRKDFKTTFFQTNENMTKRKIHSGNTRDFK